MSCSRRLFVCTCFYLLAITIGSSYGHKECTQGIKNSSLKCCIGYREIENMCTECIGFYGEECSIPCPAGFYGRQCKTPCNCSPYEICNHFVGCKSDFTCGEGHHSVTGNLKWMLMIFFICLQGFNLVFCIGYPLRKRKNWIRKMMIRKMGKCRGCFLFSQQKGKTVRNKGHSDSHPMHRSADYGYVGDGYHQIHFPN